MDTIPKEVIKLYEDLIIPKYKALITAQKEYIKFLGKEVTAMSGVARVHSVFPSDDILQEGVRLRQKLVDLESKL